jgi:hypothetical protein
MACPYVISRAPALSLYCQPAAEIACASAIKVALAAAGVRIGRARQAARLQILRVRSHACAVALVPLGGGFETGAAAIFSSEVRPRSPRADARMTSDFRPASSLGNAILCGPLPDLPKRVSLPFQFWEF